MAKTKLFKLAHDDDDGMLFIDGPDDILIGMDYIASNHQRVAKSARRVIRLLNKHWNDDGKAPTP